MKELFLLDNKKLNNELQKLDKSVYQVLKRYELEIGDYENNEFTKAIFIWLGWNNKYKDTIVSFRTIFCGIIECFSKTNECELSNGARICFFFRDNTLKYEIDGKEKNYYSYGKKFCTKRPLRKSVHCAMY